MNRPNKLIIFTAVLLILFILSFIIYFLVDHDKFKPSEPIEIVNNHDACYINKSIWKDSPYVVCYTDDVPTGYTEFEYLYLLSDSHVQD